MPLLPVVLFHSSDSKPQDSGGPASYHADLLPRIPLRPSGHLSDCYMGFPADGWKPLYRHGKLFLYASCETVAATHIAELCRSDNYVNDNGNTVTVNGNCSPSTSRCADNGATCSSDSQCYNFCGNDGVCGGRGVSLPGPHGYAWHYAGGLSLHMG